MRFSTVVAIATFIGSAFASPLIEKRAGQVITKCTVPNTAALTFDDGPWVYAYDVSKALVAAGAKGTFFFNGNNYECIYSENNAKRVKYVYDKGHQVASHTWGHLNLAEQSWDKVHDEMWRVEQALQKIVGVVPKHMRPPFGSYNQNTINVASARGQDLIIWDFDSGDSVGATPAQSKADYDALVSRRPSTILALNHETYERTVHEVLPYAIAKLQAAGYKLVTVAECLGTNPYQSVQAPGTRDSTWTC